jgi:hypothetical protein
VLSITEAQELREARSSRILRRDTSYIQLTYLMQAKTLRIKKVATVEVGGRHFNIDVEAVDTYRDSHDPCSDGLQVDPAKYTAELRHT